MTTTRCACCNKPILNKEIAYQFLIKHCVRSDFAPLLFDIGMGFKRVKATESGIDESGVITFDFEIFDEDDIDIVECIDVDYLMLAAAIHYHEIDEPLLSATFQNLIIDEELLKLVVDYKMRCFSK